MRKFHEENERIKRRYFQFIREADGKDEKTVEKVASAILRFEQDTGFKCFKRFNIEQVVAFKKRLSKVTNQQTGKPLSRSTVDSILRELRGFFRYLAGQQGYKSKISYSDAAYFNNNMKDARIAHTHRNIRFPTIEQAKHAFDQMPMEGEIAKRNRALFAFLMLTGTRIAAIASLKLKHIDLIEECVYQDANDVQTKRAKTFTTWFLPIGDEYKSAFYDWVNYLRNEKLFGNDDALFPKPDIIVNENGVFEVVGISRENYQGSTALRNVIKHAFEAANLPAFGPHSFRRTLVNWGDKTYPEREAWKAFSLNIGHSDTATTMSAYYPISAERQAELIKRSKPL
ncbi:MAG: site-specific integrase [Hyphomicrobiales bacterium]